MQFVSDRSSLIARLARGSISALAIYVSAAGLAFLSQLVLARVLGAEGYGIYAYVFAWVVVLVYFSTLGFEVALLRFVASYREHQNWGLVRGVIRYAERRVLATGLCVVIVGGLAVSLWPSPLSPTLAGTFLVGLIVVPVFALLRVRSSIVRAFGGVVSALVPSRLVQETGIVILVGTMGLVLSWPVDPVTAMAVTLLGTCVGLGLVTLAARRAEPEAVAQSAPADASGEWRRTIVPLLLLVLMEILINRTGVILSGWLVDMTYAGIYALTFSISLLVTFPQVAVSALFAPTVAALHSRGDHATLQGVVTRTSWWSFLGGLAVALPLFLIARPLLACFGPTFTDGATALQILLVAQAVFVSAGANQFLMTMMGYERQVAVQVVASAVLNALLTALLLVQGFGIEGAAIATALTLIGWNFAMGLFVWRRLGYLPGVSLGWRGARFAARSLSS